MDDLLSEFLTETSENLATLDVEIVELEKNPNDKELLGNIFRLVHTIKGTCGFLGLPRLEAVAHAGENVLGKFRDGELEVTPEGVSAILECFDQIKYLLGELEETGTEPEGNDQALIDRLNAIADGGGAPAAAEQPESAAEPAPEAAAEAEESSEEAPEDGDDLQELFNSTPGPADDLNFQGEEKAETKEPEPSPEPSAESPPAAAAKPPAPSQDKPADAGKKEASIATQSIRVNVDVLEDLMNMVSELVLTRNQLMQILRSHKDSEFALPLQRLSHITTDLQEGVMKTRMQPIGNAWAKLPRIIRDLALELNKKIELQMLGADTELDRQVLDLIKDPLTHMVRNSADHGIEMPEERVAASKPETGKVVLNAFHEGGHIIIEIKDDGKGLNLERIKEKALENGLHTAEELESMSDKQASQLIFKAGFSTAEKVTSVSGRGVGMDVVRTNIEKIGGTIELNTVQGQGSTFMIKIPLTLAIVSALIVESCGEKFAVPQLSVVELVRVSKDSEQQIEDIRGTSVLRLRNRLLPLISLEKLLKLEKFEIFASNKKQVEQSLKEDLGFIEPPAEVEAKVETEAETEVEAEAEEAETEAEAEAVKQPDEVENTSDNDNVMKESEDSAKLAKSEQRSLAEKYIIVAKVGTYSYGIIVDDVFDTEEIVVKPVAPILRDISIFSGNTILGDGSVIMILDPNGIADSTGEITLADDAAQSQDDYGSKRNFGDNVMSLLLFKAGEGGPKAVPLSLVARLEDVMAEKIEYSDGRPMVQYREKLMPIIKFDATQIMPEQGRIPLIVFTDRDHSMGLVIDDIVDIVEDAVKSDLTSESENIAGSTVIAGKATDIINVSYYLEKAFGDWFRRTGVEGNQETEESKRLLLIDDSMFFRNLIIPTLSVAGFDVKAVSSGKEALELCEQGYDFDVVVSDIEMPDMTGLQLVHEIRSHSNWKEKPVVALSSLMGEEDIKRGLEAGFDDYIAKTDRESLTDRIVKAIQSKSSTEDAEEAA